MKTFRDASVSDAPKRVNRFTTIYAFPAAFADVAQTAFAARAIDFIGYPTRAAFKAALEALQVPAAA